MDALVELAERWREEAELLRSYGATRLATAAERHADELESARAEWEMEPLTVGEAAEASGYSESQLYTLLSEDRLPNVGKKGAPRIRRGDLPRKPGGNARSGAAGPSLAEEALERRGQ